MKLKYINISILLIFTLMAAPIDQNKAQRVAGNIFAERSNVGSPDSFNIQSVESIVSVFFII